MQLPGWLRDLLWRAEDWRAVLAGALDDVRRTRDARRAIELGRALEHVEPDRRRALDAYQVAWRTGQGAGALAAARRIAREIRAHATLALLALHEFERGGDPAWLWTAGIAYLDAGEPERARGPLETALQREPGDERLAVMLRATDGDVGEVRAEVERWLERGLAEDVPDHAVLAARLARLAGMPVEDRARLLRTALDRWPADDDVAMQVEDLLLSRGDPDELLTFYKLRLGTKPGARAWAEEVRGAATRLCVRGVAPGLGLRLSRKGLEHAYDAGLVDVPGHLATWAVLVDHARAVKANRELMPLVVQALRLPLGADDRLWLARFGLATAWRDAGDDAAARPYAAILAELAPDHPDLREFIADQVQVDIDIDTDDDDVVDADLADLALSLVYLDEHGPDRVEELIVPAQRATGLAAAAAAQPPTAPASAPAPPSARPAWMSAETSAMVEVAQDAVAATDAAAIAAADGASGPPPGELDDLELTSPPTSASASRPIAIPTAALSALRRIGARVRVPTEPEAPDGAVDRAARVVVPVDVTIELDDGTQVEAMVRDLSTTGLFVLVKATLALGAELACELRLPGEDPLTAVRQRAWAKVIRQGDGGYGLLFLDPDPELIEALAAVCARLAL